MEQQDNGCKLLQNLRDAGCTEKQAAQLFSLWQAGQAARLLEQLSSHRTRLLARLHRDTRQIDCLDYLIYCLQEK